MLIPAHPTWLISTSFSSKLSCLTGFFKNVWVCPPIIKSISRVWLENVMSDIFSPLYLKPK